MDIEFETAVKTLACAAMWHAPGQRVTVGLIVSVLSRKYPRIPEAHIARIVARTVMEEGGTLDLAIPAREPPQYQRSA